MKSGVIVLAIFTAVAMPADALDLTGGPGVGEGDPYPYAQTISGPGGSFDVTVDGYSKSNPTTKYYISKFTGLGIMKTASGADNGDLRQINADEVLAMTISSLNGSFASFTRLEGQDSSYWDVDKTVYLYKNDVLVRTISCDGSTGYDISPPIVVEEGDTVSFNPSGNVRLNSFTVEIGHEPYIPNASAVTNLLDTVIATNGHYYLTADWSGLAHKPDGVVARVVNGDTGETLYFRGAMSPDTPAVDFDLLVLEPGDTVQVLAGLTGNAGEDPELWNVSLDRHDSWSGSRYNVPVVPLGLAASPSGMDIYRDLWPKTSGFRNDFRAVRGENTVLAFVAETLGHAPKSYSEELDYSDANIPILQNYAQNNPDRQVMFHWNGKMVKPFLGGTLPAKMGEFKPCHFRYNVGTYLSSSITAPATQITVDDSSKFTTNQDNVAIVIPVDPVTNERLFGDAELVTVTAISGNQLTVTRNVYQSLFSYTSAGDFAAGSYIAPASQRFVDVESGGIRYNHSLLCPVDEQGRNGADILAEMLSHEFAPGSNLDRLSGMMFDVLPRSVGASEDCNLDGIADGGLDARGVDLYHLGVQGFGRKLRAALPDRILTFDGQDDHWPALHTVFNGVEAEGFSRYNDSYTKRWSKALNYFLFAERWNQSSNFYNFCVTKQNDDPPASESRALRRFHEAGLTAMGVAVSHEPIVIDIQNGPFHALDEMRRGVENQLQWLGAPLTELIRPGLSVADELGGTGLPAAGWTSPNGSATVGGGAEGMLVSPVDTGTDHEMIIEFPGISIPAGDLLIRFEGKGGVPHLPSDTARYINVEVDGRQPNSWTFDTLTGVVNDEGFTEVTAYYRGAGAPSGSTVTLRLMIEAAADLTLRNFSFHNASDTLLREFENGIVLCNPSENPETFDLSSFFPGQQFHRIQGQADDDPVVNDGSAVGSSVQLDGHRGLFLIKDLVDVVGFDRTGLGSTSRTYPTSSNQFSAVWDFSETVPLVTSENGTNATIYGGIIDTWTVASNYTPWVRFLFETFQNQVNPDNGSDTTAKGMLVWKKADFLSGASTHSVSLASGGKLSCSVFSGVGTRQTHFVVKQGGNYYVSEDYLTGNGTLTISPSATQWAPISTLDYSIGTFTSNSSNSFTDIEAAGLYYSISAVNNQSIIRIDGFNLMVPAGSLSTPPENAVPVFTADPIVAAHATEGSPYSSSIAGSATDGDDDTLTYTRQSGGAAWLNVAGDGILSGTPSPSDVGLNSVTVQVDDGNGGSDTAVLEIAVTTAPPLVVDLKITPSGTGGGMDITWVGEIGTTYQLQGSADLAIGKWEKIGETVLGTGGVITIPVNPVEDSYFYRIVTP